MGIFFYILCLIHRAISAISLVDFVLSIVKFTKEKRRQQ